MRLYRFIKEDEDDNIDVTVVTDGVNDQKKVFITDIQGIAAPGDVTEDGVANDAGAALVKLGFNYKVGHAVMHEELVAFAENKGLELEITPQGLATVTGVIAEWTEEGDACIVTVNMTAPVRKKVEIHFPDSVTLNDSVERYGEVSADKKSLFSNILSGDPMTFTLEDLNLLDSEDLNIVVVVDGVQTFEVTASKA